MQVEHSGMSLEKQLLCAGARSYLDGSASEHVLPLIQQKPHWNDVLGLAWTEGFGPVLLSQLKLFNSSGYVPDGVLKELERLSRKQLTYNLQQTKLLVELVQELEEQGIPVIPFKGPSLAQQLYRDVGVRRSSDLDLFVHRDAIPEVKKILLAKGYEPDVDFSSEEEAEFIRRRLAYEFVKPSSQSKVEIHWALLPLHNGSTIPPELVWERHTWATVGGTRLRSMHTRLLLPYLCAHASKHCWAKLKWILDIALLIHSCSDEEIDEACSLAEEIGCERMLNVGFILSQKLLGVSIPEPVTDVVDADNLAQNLADDVVSRWLFEATADDEDLVQAFWFHFRERERWRDRWPFLRHNLWLFFTPTEKDHRFVQLPKRVQFLYVFLRPFRIMMDRLGNTSGVK